MIAAATDVGVSLRASGALVVGVHESDVGRDGRLGLCDGRRAWWRRVVGVSGLVRQVYFSAPHVVARGRPAGASRSGRAVLANALASEAAIRRAFPLTKRRIATRERTLLSRGGRGNVLVRLRPTMSRGLYLLVYADTLRREHARAAWGGTYGRRLTQATRAHLRWLGCPSVLEVKPVPLFTLAERRLR